MIFSDIFFSIEEYIVFILSRYVLKSKQNLEKDMLCDVFRVSFDISVLNSSKADFTFSVNITPCFDIVLKN